MDWNVDSSDDDDDDDDDDEECLMDLRDGRISHSLRHAHVMDGPLRSSTESYVVTPLGQSGQFNSPHSCDQ